MDKHLILMRHAEAQLEKYGENDRARSLTMSGFHEIDSVRLKLNSRLSDVSLALCSSVKRARQTLEGLRVLLSPHTKIVYEENFYQTSTPILWEKIKTISDEYECVLIIGHNPSITDFVKQFDPNFLGFSTCSLAFCRHTHPSWTTASPLSFRFLEYISS
jgi:phosphohistidine phosphatase